MRITAGALQARARAVAIRRVPMRLSARYPLVLV